MFQIFVIAKNTERYQCLASIRCPLSCPLTTLKSCHCILQAFDAKDNHPAISAELRDLTGNTHDIGDYRQQPFPAIVECLLAGYSSGSGHDINPDDVQLLTLNNLWNSVDANQSFLIVDLSDLQHLRYSFEFPSEGKSLRARSYLLRLAEEYMHGFESYGFLDIRDTIRGGWCGCHQNSLLSSNSDVQDSISRLS
jgi:hypothetical protein